MKEITEYVRDKQSRFAEHRFFAELEGRTIELGRFAPFLSFWVLTFQDLLAVNESRIGGEVHRSIAVKHRREDSGHDRWFFQDLRALNVKPPTVREVFGMPHTATRRASFALMSEVFRPCSDNARIALLLCLESAGHIFFSRVADHVRAAHPDQGLRYFSHAHLELETGHDLFEDDTWSTLSAIRLHVSAREELTRLVDRCFEAFHAMFDGLLSTLEMHVEAPALEIRERRRPTRVRRARKGPGRPSDRSGLGA